MSQLDFISAMKIATGVFDQYKVDQLKWWKRMDGTPILNDVAVRMAEAFRDAIESSPLLPQQGREQTDSLDHGKTVLMVQKALGFTDSGYVDPCAIVSRIAVRRPSAVLPQVGEAKTINGASILNRGFKREGKADIPTLLIAFPEDDWDSRDAMATAISSGMLINHSYIIPKDAEQRCRDAFTIEQGYGNWDAKKIEYRVFRDGFFASLCAPASLGEAKAVAKPIKFTDKQINELAEKSGFYVKPNGTNIFVSAINGGCTSQVKRLIYLAIESANHVAQALPVGVENDALISALKSALEAFYDVPCVNEEYHQGYADRHQQAALDIESALSKIQNCKI